MKTIIDFYNTNKKRIATYEVIDAYKIVEKIDFYADDFGRLGYDRGYDVNDDAEEIHLYFQGKASNAKEFASFLLKNGYIREIKDSLYGKQKTATALTVTVFKNTSTLHRVGLPRTYKRRSTTTKPRLANTERDAFRLFGTNIKQFIDTTKLKELINNFAIDNAEDFIKEIGKCFPQQEVKERKTKRSYDSKYQLLDFSEFGVKILFRISDHNINTDNIIDDVEETYSIALKSIKSKNTFKPNDLTVTEYVYFTEKCDSHRYLLIALELLAFLETSEWNNDFVPADVINHSPDTENLGAYVSNFINEYKKTNEKLKKALSTETGTFKFAQHISELYGQGEKLDWLKAKKIAKDFNIETETEIMQACELAVVLTAREIAQNGNSIRQQYEEMKDLYERQVTIRPLDTKSKVLQQYSTPCPLAYLLGKFVTSGKQDGFSANIYLEPSAGNGMLTIALPKKNTYVNELDEIRVENLKKQGFAEVTNFDASVSENIKGRYKGIITNPPFAELKVSEYLSRTGKKGNNNIQYVFQKLDHKMAIIALESMKSDGRCAIIIGGKMGSRMMRHEESYWKNGRLFGAFNTFVSYLNRQYNLVDILYINGDLYGKQGTTFPIVVLLIDGRKEWDSEPTTQWHTYDIAVDAQINSYEEIFQRMIKHIDPKQSDSIDAKRKRALAIMLKRKMVKAKNNALPLGNTDNKVKFNFRKQLTQFFANTFAGRFIGVTMPQKILLECGIPNLPIVIRPVQLKEKIVKHNLTKDIIKNLNTSINAPLLVFKSLTKIGTFNVIIEKQNEEGIICVSLHPNKEIVKIEVTEIASIHGRNLDQLINWCENNALLYGNSEKTKKVLICSQFNSTKSEYLVSLIDNANIEKKSESTNNSQEKKKA